MSEAALLNLTTQGLLLVLYGAGPPLVAGALAGALTELAQRRAGVEGAALPGVARLLVGLLTVLALGPATAGQLARFASALWTALPTLVQQMAELSGVAAVELVAPWLRQGGALLLVAACRCGPLLLAVPRLGILGRVVALIFGTLLVAPLLAPAITAAGPELFDVGPALLPLCLRELLIGGSLALAAALPWAVAHSVGALLDGGRSRGPTESPRSREAAQLYGALALALFFGLGGARLVVSALAASYELVPLPTPQHPLAAAPTAALPSSGQALILLSGRLLWLAIRLALPLLAAQLLAELLVALPSRWFAPTTTRPSHARSPLRSLIWLAVLILGAQALFPEFRKLLMLWPSLLRLALDAR